MRPELGNPGQLRRQFGNLGRCDQSSVISGGKSTDLPVGVVPRFPSAPSPVRLPTLLFPGAARLREASSGGLPNSDGESCFPAAATTSLMQREVGVAATSESRRLLKASLLYSRVLHTKLCTALLKSSLMDTTLSLDFVIMLVPIVLFLGAVSTLLGRLPLAPLRLARLDPLPQIQYLMTDVYVLLAQEMVVGLFINVFQPSSYGAERFRITQAMMITPLLAWWWWLGIKWLSQAGIKSTIRRAEVLILAIPAAFGGPLLIVPVAIKLYFSYLKPQVEYIPPTEGTLLSKGIPWALALMVVFLFYMFFFGCNSIILRALSTRARALGKSTC